MITTTPDTPTPTADPGFWDVVTTTRAIRRYRDEDIPEEDLRRIFHAATRAPSGSNRQGFRFLVLRRDDAAAEARALLGASFRDMWRSKRSSDGYDEGSGADPTSRKARQARAMDVFVDNFEQTPVVILACLRRHRKSVDISDGASVYPAVQNLLLGARALGYGGVLTVWHRFVEDELRELLAIPDDVEIAATVPLGRPQGSHGPVRRRPLREFVFDGRWDDVADWVGED